jgi:hypothetical protein
MSTGDGKPASSRSLLYRTESDSDGRESVSVAVVEAIATVKEIDPETWQFCLHDYLDPDALDALVASHETDLTLTFTVETHTVTIESDGTVTIAE